MTEEYVQNNPRNRDLMMKVADGELNLADAIAKMDPEAAIKNLIWAAVDVEYATLFPINWEA